MLLSLQTTVASGRTEAEALLDQTRQDIATDTDTRNIYFRSMRNATLDHRLRSFASNLLTLREQLAAL